MPFGFLGVDHKKLSVSGLEANYLAPSDASNFIQQVSGVDTPLSELVVLLTCNRIELYFSSENLNEGSDYLLNALYQFSSSKSSWSPHVFQRLYDIHAMTHLFSVASGVESMIFGENEILTQIKNAYEQSRCLNRTGAMLNKVFQSAIYTGKRVRTETPISHGAYSMSSIAIDMVRNIFPNYHDLKIGIIGSGTIANRILKKLSSLEQEKIYLTNRTQKNALNLYRKFSTIQLFPYEKKESYIHHLDVVISAVSAPQFVIGNTDVVFKESCLKLLIDLGVPRNIHPNIAKLYPVTLKTVDDIRNIANKTTSFRKQYGSYALAIIHSEVERCMKWIAYREILCKKFSV